MSVRGRGRGRGGKRGRPRIHFPRTYESTGTSWGNYLSEEDRQESLLQLGNLLNDLHSPQKSKHVCVTIPQELCLNTEIILTNGDTTTAILKDDGLEEDEEELLSHIDEDNSVNDNDGHHYDYSVCVKFVNLKNYFDDLFFLHTFFKMLVSVSQSVTRC